MAPQTFNLLGGSKIPVIGLGTFTVTDEKQLENALNVALETGYRHIDTAQLYQNEHVIGKVLKTWFDSGKLKREDIFITTKLPGYGVHPDRVERYMKQSLEQLQLDYVDLFLIHFPICIDEPKEAGSNASTWTPEPTDLVGTWKKLEEQVDLGRTKAIGVSNFNQHQVSKIIAYSRIKPAANQVELHVYLQQKELVKYCQDNGMVMGSYFSLGNPGYNTFQQARGRPANPDQGNVLRDATVKQIGDKYNKTPAQILLKYLITKKITVIPKSVTDTRLRENFNLFDFTLSSDDVKTLEGLDRGEEGRLAKMTLSKAFTDHPEFPFPRDT